MATASISHEQELENLRDRLKWDFPFYADQCLKIVPKGGSKLVPFTLKDQQLALDEKLEAQRLAGRPQRGIILKARQIGFSTYGVGKLVQRVTQRAFHNALIVGHDKKSPGELWEKAEIMLQALPPDPELGIKPSIRNFLHRQAFFFGSTGRMVAQETPGGFMSKLLVDTANEAEGGRGFTYHTLLLTEVAFWQQVSKLNALLETVPDDPETLVLIECTANGFNHFRQLWLAAQRGESDFVAHFVNWLTEEEYQAPFMDEEDRAAFEATIGNHEYGEDEPDLLELGATLEQLQWRRRKIATTFKGDIRLFKQEYPSTADEAFLASGSTRFASVLISRALREAEETDGQCEWGKFEPEGTRTQRTPFGTLEVPYGPRWVKLDRKPARPEGHWRIWGRPQERSVSEELDAQGQRLVIPEGQYVGATDPQGGEANLDVSQSARNAIIFIDHRSFAQVAEYVSYEDADQIAWESYLAALYWKNAWLVTEITGGFGRSIAGRHANGYYYPFAYRRFKRGEHNRPEAKSVIGWSTDGETKPYIEDLFAEQLREGTHGVRSLALASEMSVFLKDARGKTGPEDGEYSDRLMARMIAGAVAKEKPLRREKPRSSATGGGKRVVSKVGGYALAPSPLLPLLDRLPL